MRPTCNSFHFFKENPNHFTAEIWILEAHLPMYWLGNWVDLAINRFCIPWKNLLTVTCFPFFWSRMPIFFEGAVMRIVAAEKTLLLTPGRIRKIINFFVIKWYVSEKEEKLRYQALAWRKHWWSTLKNEHSLLRSVYTSHSSHYRLIQLPQIGKSCQVFHVLEHFKVPYYYIKMTVYTCSKTTLHDWYI